MSDWGAQHSGVSSALAGLDQTMPGDEGFDSGSKYPVLWFGEGIANLLLRFLLGQSHLVRSHVTVSLTDIIYV